MDFLNTLWYSTGSYGDYWHLKSVLLLNSWWSLLNDDFSFQKNQMHKKDEILRLVYGVHKK